VCRGRPEGVLIEITVVECTGMVRCGYTITYAEFGVRHTRGQHLREL
jgi:hypothetical protein